MNLSILDRWYPVPLLECWSEQVGTLIEGCCQEVFGCIPCGVSHQLVPGTTSQGTDPQLSLEGHN